MPIALPLNREKDIEQEAQQRGYADAGQYIVDLFEADRQRQSKACNHTLDDLKAAYLETYDQNLLLSEEGFAAEQEAYERYVEGKG